MITRAIVLAFAAAILTAPAAAQQPLPGATVEVTVHDSLSGGPLVAAMVQLVSATDPAAFSRVGESDARGRVTFRDIPAGRYSAGFMHPALDAIGISAPVREVRVDGDGSYRVDLAIPSAARLRVAICGPRVDADSSAVFIGSVRDPRDGMPVAGGSVTGQWIELTFGTAGVQQRAPRITATTGANGWFALCGLPAGTVTLFVKGGQDSLPPMDVEMKAMELRRSDLYLAMPGRGRLSGKVVSADSGRPLAGARVSVEGGVHAESNAQGEWTLANVPLGTRMLEVRTIGYYPERRPVNVLADPAGPVDVALQTFQAVLDAVRVTATRLVGEAALSGFAERRRGSGMGRFYDAEQIGRRNPLYTSDLLRTLPGFAGDGSLTMKGNFSDGAGNFGVGCTAEVYVDGQIMRGISASELDGLVAPENIAALETYSAGSPRPPQFDSGMSGCGALVIWQKPMSERLRRR